MDYTFLRTRGQVKYYHLKGEISQVLVSAACLGLRKVRIANSLPQLPHEVIYWVMNS